MSLTPIAVERAGLRAVASLNGKMKCAVTVSRPGAGDAPPLAVDTIDPADARHRDRLRDRAPADDRVAVAALLDDLAEQVVAYRVGGVAVLAAGAMPARPASGVVRGEQLTDLGNAERLALQYGRELRFVPEWDAWLFWDGRRWARDIGNVEIMRRAKATVRAIYREAADRADDTSAALAKHAAASERGARIAAMIELAKSEPELAARAADFDRAPYRLNLLNGTFDLRAAELVPHDPADLLTKLAPVAYDDAARCPRFETFLLETFANDAERAFFLQRLVGYTAAGVATEHKLPFLYGKGRNGKGTMVRLLNALLGDYAATLPVSALLESKEVRTGPRPDLMALRGARFAGCAEPSKGRRFDEGLLKNITGGDVLSVRSLHEKHMTEFTPEFTIWFVANDKPDVRGTDEGIWSRIVLIPFDVIVPEERRDKELDGKLQAELPGVFNRLAEGFRAWQQLGLAAPAVVRAATQEYRAEQDVLGAFLAACCATEEGAEAGASALWDAYKGWAERAGEYALTQTRFGRELTARGFTPFLGGARGKTMHRRGLRPLTSAEQGSA